MTFTDLTFIFIFLPIALLLYYIAAKRFREIILLAVSLLFYACGSLQYFGFLLVILVADVILGLALEKIRERRAPATVLLVIGIVFHVGILGYYKYFDFATDTVNRIAHTSFAARDLLLPLGLSYFTFKAISYLADVYRGKVEMNSPLTAAAYLSFFGQIQMGPIARYEDFQGGGRKHLIRVVSLGF